MKRFILNLVLLHETPIPQPASPEGSSDAGSPAVDPGVAELTADLFGEEAQPGTPEPTPQGAEPVPGQPGAPPRSAESQQRPTAPQEKKFNVRGQSYTAAELAQRPDLLEALAQSAEQLPNLTKRHQEILDQLAAKALGQGGPQQAPAGQQPAQAPQFSQAEIRAAYDPLVANAVKQGYIEEEFALVYPNAAAQMLFNVDLMYDARAAVQGIANVLTTGRREVDTQQQRGQVFSVLDQVAGSDPFYAPMKEGATKNEFLRYLIEEVNPTLDKMTPEFVARQWVAFRHEEIRRNAATQAEASRDKRTRDRKLAVGVGGGSGPKAPLPAEGFDAELESLGIEMK